MAAQGQYVRKRARAACLACNARRVKCNVTESKPCHNCIASNVACETRESRRGKHPRRPRRTDGGESVDLNHGPQDGAPQHTARSSISHYDDEVTASQVLASLSSNNPNGFNQSYEDDASSVLTDQPSISNHTSKSDHIPSRADAEPNNRQEDDGSVFLGESTSLRCISDEQTANTPSPHSLRLRHSVPNAVKAEALMPQWETERRISRINALNADGAFSFPPTPIREQFLKAYFQWFHPCFAIVDESSFWNSYYQSAV